MVPLNVMMPVRSGAIGLDDPGRRRLHARVGLVHLFGHHVLGIAEVDDGPRLTTALGLDPREVAESEAFEPARRAGC